MSRPKRIAKAPGSEVAKGRDQETACNLRADGLTFAEVAERMGISETWARKLVDQAIEAIITEPAKNARAVELRHLQRMRAGLARNGANDGDPKAVTAAVKVAERIARLKGLDAPVKVKDLTERGLKDLSDSELVALRDAIVAAESRS